MSIVPLRGLADIGVVKSAAYTETPPNAWTVANNVRCHNKRVKRSPVFRTYQSVLSTSVPYAFFGAHPSTASDAFFYTDLAGQVYRRISAGTTANVTSATHTNSNQTYPVTNAQLGDNTLINRQDEQPWYITPVLANFIAMPGWTSTHTAKSIRTYKDFIVALNITKTGVNYPYMVKTSDSTPDTGVMPTSWDHTDPTKLATENVLNQLSTPLVDGWPLGDDFFLYTSDGVWKMSFRGDSNIFDYRDTGIGKGVINANCVVNAKRMSYVFGFNDIYRHDGIMQESIVEASLKEYVFRTIDRSKADRCFTFHDERLNTIYFCYPSATDTEATWQNATQCNRAVAFNYENNTATLVDMPNVCGVAYASPLVTDSWTTITGAWSAHSEFWASFDDSVLLLPMLAAGVLAGTPAIANSAIYSFDLISDSDAFFPSLPVDTAITPPVTLAREDLDLDEMGLGIAVYKNIRSLMPQIRSSALVDIRFGYSMVPNDAMTWGAYQSFDPTADYKVDTMTGGRRVGFGIRYTSTSTDFELSGIDLDITGFSKK